MKAVACAGNKGGVGKSMVAANLAHQLQAQGLKVGVLDADMDSPYLVEMIGAREKITLSRNRQMIPVEVDGMKIMSFALWVQGEFQGATMHGDFHGTWIRDALKHTDWGDIDVLVVDLPAGQRDEYLTIANTLGESLLGLVAVAEPHIVSALERVYDAASYHRLRILGVIENKSGPIFGTGRIEAYCKRKGLNFYGSIPLSPRIPLAHERGELWLPDDLSTPIQAAAKDIKRRMEETE